MKYLKVYTDWGSRWNPGSAGIWVCIQDECGNILEKRYKFLWVKTNNEAEYLGAYYGIKRACELWADKIWLYMDSSLVISQLSWKWKIKKAELRELYNDIQWLKNMNHVDIEYTWIPREQNKEADRLSNVAMDSVK